MTEETTKPEAIEPEAGPAAEASAPEAQADHTEVTADEETQAADATDSEDPPAAGSGFHSPEQLQRIVEACLLAAGKALTLNQLLELFGDGEKPDRASLRAALEDIASDCEGRGWELREVASGFRLQVRDDMAPWVSRLWEERPQRYSRALMETLALIAYRQPITRGDIEDIRGVAVSSNIIRTLRERDWIRVVGHKEVPGRPAMYATTRTFLDYFNLKSLEELPNLPDIKDLDSLNQELELVAGSAEAPAEAPAEAADSESAADAEDATPAEETAETNADVASDETSDDGDNASAIGSDTDEPTSEAEIAEQAADALEEIAPDTDAPRPAVHSE